MRLIVFSFFLFSICLHMHIFACFLPTSGKPTLVNCIASNLDLEVDDLKKFIQKYPEQDFNRAFIFAAKKGRWKILHYLIDNFRAKIQRDTIGECLTYACFLGHFDTVKKVCLFLQGVIYAQEKDHVVAGNMYIIFLNHALLKSVEGEGNLAVIRFLEDQGGRATPDAFFQAILKGNIKLFESFKQRYTIDMKDVRAKRGETLLHAAMLAVDNQLEVVEMLLEDGFSVFALDNNKHTPLEYLILHNKYLNKDSIKIVDMLLAVDSYYANEVLISLIREKTVVGFYKDIALQMVQKAQDTIGNKTSRLSNFILNEKDLSVEKFFRFVKMYPKNNYGKALVCAVYRNNQPVLAYFFKVASHEPDDYYKLKALRIAVSSGYLPLVKTIVSNLKVNIEAAEFENFLIKVVKSKNEGLFDYFIRLFLNNFEIKVRKETVKKEIVSSFVVVVDNVFEEAIKTGSVFMVEKFFKIFEAVEGKTDLEKDFLKNRLNRASRIASANGNVALLRLLIDHGADDKTGMFQEAFCNARPEAIEFLLSEFESIKHDLSTFEMARPLFAYYKSLKKDLSFIEILKLLGRKYNELKGGLGINVLEYILKKEKLVAEDDKRVVQVLLAHDWFCKKEHLAFALQSIKTLDDLSSKRRARKADLELIKKEEKEGLRSILKKKSHEKKCQTKASVTFQDHAIKREIFRRIIKKRSKNQGSGILCCGVAK